MELPLGLRLENVWKNKTPELKEEIIDFWVSNKALRPGEHGRERVEQVFSVVRNEAGNIASICSIFVQFIEQLSNEFYCFRTFIAAPYRRSHIASIMIVNTRDFLNQRFAEGEQTKVIGMFVTAENEYLKKFRNQAIWPYSKFIYVGKNSRGDHLRVYYFDNALIC